MSVETIPKIISRGQGDSYDESARANLNCFEGDSNRGNLSHVVSEDQNGVHSNALLKPVAPLILDEQGLKKIISLLELGRHKLYGDIILMHKCVETLLARKGTDCMNMMIHCDVVAALLSTIDWCTNGIPTKQWNDDQKKVIVGYLCVENSLRLISKLTGLAHAENIPWAHLCDLCCDLLFKSIVYKKRKNILYFLFQILADILKKDEFVGQVSNFISGLLKFANLYSNDRSLTAVILVCISSLLRGGQNKRARDYLLDRDGMDSIIDSMYLEDQVITLHATTILNCLTISCVGGMHRACDYESCENYAMTRMLVKSLGIFRTGDPIHRRIQKNILSLFICLSKVGRKARDLLKTGLDLGLTVWTLNAVKDFPEDRRLQFLGVWLLGILITLSQNKDMMNGEHSDSDYSSDEEDRYPTSNLSIAEETKLQQHLRQGNTQHLLLRLKKFIEKSEAGIPHREPSQIIETNEQDKTACPAMTKEGKNAAPPQFKTVVEFALRSLKWFDEYIEHMKNARDIIAAEEKAAAEELKNTVYNKK